MFYIDAADSAAASRSAALFRAERDQLGVRRAGPDCGRVGEREHRLVARRGTAARQHTQDAAQVLRAVAGGALGRELPEQQ